MTTQRQLALVTGGSGFVGNNLVRHLLSLGHRVRVFNRQDSPRSLAGLEVENVVGDLLDRRRLDQAMEGVDVVYHSAAMISIDPRDDREQMRRINIEGTRSVVESAVQHRVRRLIHISSIEAICPDPRHEPIDESRSLVHHSDDDPLAYGLSKADGERLVTDAVACGLDATILNPVGVIGPHDYTPSATGELILQLMGRRLPALVRSGYYWIDVRDVAAAAVAAAQCGATGERYILKGEYATFSSIAAWVHQEMGARPPRLNFPLWTARSAAPLVERISRLAGRRPLITPESIEIVSRHQRIDTDKAQQHLGFEPRPLQTTIAETVTWLQSQMQAK